MLLLLLLQFTILYFDHRTGWCSAKREKRLILNCSISVSRFLCCSMQFEEKLYSLFSRICKECTERFDQITFKERFLDFYSGYKFHIIWHFMKYETKFLSFSYSLRQPDCPSVITKCLYFLTCIEDSALTLLRSLLKGLSNFPDKRLFFQILGT